MSRERKMSVEHVNELAEELIDRFATEDLDEARAALMLVLTVLLLKTGVNEARAHKMLSFTWNTIKDDVEHFDHLN